VNGIPSVTKIITVTANTAVDKLVGIGDIAAGSATRGVPAALFPAGKGINVARTVEALGKRVVALGLVGRNARPLFEKLNSPLLTMQLIEVPGETRINVTLLDPSIGATNHIKNPGFTIRSGDLESLTVALRRTISCRDIVVISGSLPSGADSGTYEHLVRECRLLDASVILDSSGDELRRGLKGHPFMIKPNIEELEELVGRRLGKSEPAIAAAAKEITAEGVDLVVVSRGSLGVIVVSRNDDKVLKANVAVKSSSASDVAVGSGDALVGGFAVGLLEHRSVAEIIRLGVACGAANLLTIGPGACTLRDIEELLPKVLVEELSIVS
jgi:1-phosphofructokinase